MAPTARKSLYGLIIVVGIGGAGYMLFGRGKEDVATNTEHFLIDGVCLACKTETQTNVPRDEIAPHPCAKCGQKAVYPWWYCYECKKRFVPALVRGTEGPPRIPLNLTCANCQSGNVTPYLPQAQLEQPVGDAPLPAWP